MKARRHDLTEQLVVRVTPAMYHALQADADANGRTVAQSVRFMLSKALPFERDAG